MVDDALRDAVAKMLYREMKECCNGYVEYIPDEDLIGECGVTFDGDIAIDALAEAVIEAFRTDFAAATKYPTARIVAEGPITPGPGSEALQDAVRRALGTVKD
jgi:hypothetical protein